MCTIASVQARMGSSRLPGKVLLPLPDRPILDLVVRECEKADLVDETVVAVGDAPENEAITRWADRRGIEYVVGPEDDLVRRHLSVLRDFDGDVLVRIGADSPLLPAREIDRVLSEHTDAGSAYTTNFEEAMPVGVIADVLESNVLEDLRERGKTHPVKPIREDPERYETTRTSNPAWSSIADVDLEVDTPADYWRIYQAVETVGLDTLDVGRWLRDCL